MNRNQTIKYKTPNAITFTGNPEGILLAREAAKNQYIFDQFDKFVAAFANFAKIGDYHPGQVIWDGNRWVLLDWFGATKLADGLRIDSVVIDFIKGKPGIEDKYLDHLNKIVSKHRQRAMNKKCSALFLN